MKRGAITYHQREQRALDDLATRTLVDPRASEHELDAARARLLGTREDFQVSRLAPEELRDLVRLLAKGLGRAL